MRYTYQIRKHFSVAAAAVLSACMLFGCTKADVSSSSQSASGSNSASQGTVSSSTSDGSLAGAGSTSGKSSLTVSSGQTKAAADSSADTGQNTSAGTGQDTSADTGKAVPTITGQTAQNVSGTTTPAQPQAAAAQPQTDAAPAPAQDPAPEVVSSYTDEAFNGEFEKSDGSETVDIAVAGGGLISFQFSASGIGATAQASGSSAVYYGDDGYGINFVVSGDALSVSISGADAYQSAMNGTYYRVLDGAEESVDEDYDDEDDDESYEDADWEEETDVFEFDYGV